jgi:hypothetical protein
MEWWLAFGPCFWYNTDIVQAWLTTEFMPFSSPDPKGSVSYCHHLATVVPRIASGSLDEDYEPMEINGQFKPV